MKLATTVTLFVGTVLFLAINAFAAETTTITVASSQPSTVNQTLNSTTKPAKKTSDTPTYDVIASLSRSTSLIDHQDGSRSDSMDFSISPGVRFSFGRLMTYFSYSQNLRDEYSETENDFGDVPVTFIFPSTTLDGWIKEYKSSIGYSTTAAIPASKLSTKRDQLQTSLSGKISYSLTPNDEGFSFGVSISAGRNFHQFEEDINGNVLNQYSSNQGIKIGYGIGDWSLDVDYIHKTRWTYKGNIKTSFELSQEIGYQISKIYSVAVGHTNAGSSLKPNGTDSNIEFLNESNSVVYGSLTLSYL